MRISFLFWNIRCIYLPIILEVFSLSSVNRYLILSSSDKLVKKESVFEITEWSSCLMSSYSWQYIKKCCSSSMQFLLHIKHVRSSIGIDAPLFSYFPVCIRNACAPNLSLVTLILCAGFVITFR